MRANRESFGLSNSKGKATEKDPYEFQSDNRLTFDAQSRKLEDDITKLCKKQQLSQKEKLRQLLEKRKASEDPIEDPEFVPEPKKMHSASIFMPPPKKATSLSHNPIPPNRSPSSDKSQLAMKRKQFGSLLRSGRLPLAQDASRPAKPSTDDQQDRLPAPSIGVQFTEERLLHGRQE